MRTPISEFTSQTFYIPYCLEKLAMGIFGLALFVTQPHDKIFGKHMIRHVNERNGIYCLNIVPENTFQDDVGLLLIHSDLEYFPE